METSEENTPQEGLISREEIYKIRGRWENPQTFIDLCEKDLLTISTTVEKYDLPNKYPDLIAVIERNLQALREWADGRTISILPTDLQFKRKDVIDEPHLENLKKISTSDLSLTEEKQISFFNEAQLALHAIQNAAVGPIAMCRTQAIYKKMGVGNLNVITDNSPTKQR